MPARMIPSGRPLPTASKAEPPFYFKLESQLPDEFTVIHSLKWLSSAHTRENRRVAPTGEIDFLVLHPELGILAVEVKGGRIKHEQNTFKYVDSGIELDPINQVRNGTHGLANWIGGALGIRRKFGYAVAFPDSEMHGRPIPPSLEDMSIEPAENIAIDMRDIPRVEERVIEIMQFWRRAFGPANLKHGDINRIIASICPNVDYSPTWTSRIERDRLEWLTLTEQQAECLGRIEKAQRMVVEGRSGTGKTLLAIELARRLSAQGKRVLFVTYNKALLLEKLRPELRGTFAEVTSFHELCREASTQLGSDSPQTNTTEVEDWYTARGPKALHDAIIGNRLEDYDALIVDEGQVLSTSWFEDLSLWFVGKKIVVFCDESQVFTFEDNQSSSVEVIGGIIGAVQPFTLTVSLRSPNSVFERVRELMPSNHQEISLRPTEDDALSEYIEVHPELRLHAVLADLRAAGIPAQSVVVVYMGDEPSVENWPTDYVPRTESVFKYRGLESPVVVVYASGQVSDGALACAYTRATSRCIVIYDAKVFLYWKTYGCQFTSRLISSANPPPSLSSLLNVAGSIRITTPLIEIDTASVQLHWSPHWNGWVITEGQSPDLIHCGLWKNYLCHYSGYPVFLVSRNEERQDIIVIKSSNVTAITDAPRTDYSHIKWCSTCNRWTRTRIDGRTRGLVCEEEEPIQALEVSQDEVGKIRQFDEILVNWPKATKHQKQSLPLHLLALAYWRTLTNEQRNLVATPLRDCSGEFDRVICGVLVAVDLASTQPGVIVELKDLREKHIKWHPAFEKEIGLERWKTMIAPKVASWLTRGLISKISTGVYLRLGNSEQVAPRAEANTN